VRRCIFLGCGFNLSGLRYSLRKPGMILILLCSFEFLLASCRQQNELCH
jgi:hypothetical protein